jgi:hypothetical protein
VQVLAINRAAYRYRLSSGTTGWHGNCENDYRRVGVDSLFEVVYSPLFALHRTRVSDTTLYTLQDTLIRRFWFWLSQPDVLLPTTTGAPNLSILLQLTEKDIEVGGLPRQLPVCPA